jgi:hypothetical protein
MIKIATLALTTIQRHPTALPGVLPRSGRNKPE